MIEIDETLPPEEQDRIFREAVEQTHQQLAKFVYDKSIKGGASAEEATRLAGDIQISL